MLYPKLQHHFATCNIHDLLLLRKVTGDGSAESQSSLRAAAQGTLLLLPALPCLVQVTTPPWISGFASALIFLEFACLECEQFRAGPLHCCTSNLRWAPRLFAAYMLSHSSNNGPGPVTCDTCSSFASCSGTDVIMFLTQRRDCTLGAIQLQYRNYWRGCKHWTPFWSHLCLTLTLPGSCVTAPLRECPFLTISWVELIRTPHLPL